MTQKTCATCEHIGRRYWGDDYNPDHHCAKSKERRATQFQSCGDRAQDFLDEFRKFFDAAPLNHACPFYHDRAPVSADKLAVLQEVQSAGGRKLFGFFSKENRLATEMNGRFLQENTGASEMNGFRAYRITKVGLAELASAFPPSERGTP